jgi:hypothetical protein
MRAKKLLHSLLDNACRSIDKRIKRTLFETAETLTRCKQISIASLGRSLTRRSKVKHNIKCIDRLFGNKTLHAKHFIFYKAMANLLVKNNKRPLIIIDWSGLTSCGNYYFLRAALATKGRALTLYEQSYPLNEYMKPTIHKQFLERLKQLLPEHCVPIIITDAGFRNTWFRAVQEVGWDFIGRVRNNTKYYQNEQNLWEPIKSFYKVASAKPKYLGDILLAKTNSLACHLYIKKEKKKYRIKQNLAGKRIQSSVSKKHEKRENEPWLITTSLSPREFTANRIMQLYKKRMQIEEAFRDLKNTRNGLGLRHCRSFNVGRLNVALLIAALAQLVLWIIGIAARERGLQYSFQSNTVRRRTVLSNFIIGWQVLLRKDIKLKRNELINALNLVSAEALCLIAC